MSCFVQAAWANRSMRTTLSGALTVLLSGIGPGHAAKLSLKYEAYLSGFHSGSIAIDADISAERYRLSADLKSRGFIHLLIRYAAHAESRGRLQEHRVVADRHRADTKWMREKRWVQNDYKTDGSVTNATEPTAEQDDRDPVPAALMTRTLDPLSAILHLVRGAAGNNASRCEDQVPVFDGRRRYDLVVSAGGMETIDGPAYSGPAFRCDVRLERITGFSRDPWLPRSKTPRVSHVWVAELAPDLPPQVVRIEANTGLGTAVLKLTKMKRE